MHPAIHSSAQHLPLFPIGALICTASVDTLIREGRVDPLLYVCRHVSGDWGDLCEEDRHANTSAVELGNRILSSYQIAPDLKIWVITEADRSVTTILLPEDY
ncbi:hypothetical protein [Pseudomonas huaxiensis]|uniref:hypothetical protein n=1 Tax=Pseudomonas huaxiensis TaxID=2213017 RepID=UPI000DA6D402|nr:hypothetical protein [Pseudomonas huaxiensis]